LKQSDEDDYPEFLKAALDRYIHYYETNLKRIIDRFPNSKPNQDEDHLTYIKKLSDGIYQAVIDYYDGNVLKAMNTFNNALVSIKYEYIKTETLILEGKSFFRARINYNKSFTRSDLFHVPFQLRHIVSTNRYSIPGLPALYLGDSTYVCWEEFNRYKLRDISFAQFRNIKWLRPIRLQRFEDLIKEIETYSLDEADSYLLRYLVVFPLTLACTMCVKHHTATFKPEYIIPQLLLQHVSGSSDTDGIMYPSTKVDYSKLVNISAYNFVFPVKKSSSKGYCSTLKERFELTSPTSLELEEVIFNRKYPSTSFGSRSPNKDVKTIELISGLESKYEDSSFGRIENSLKSLAFEKII
jgi:hypothetical protein